MDQTRSPTISRWERAPGYDRLLDRARALIRADLDRPGHAHWVIARSKNGRIDFDFSLQERFDHPCPELVRALDAIEDESERTCELCGEPGTERPSHPYHTLCQKHAETGPKRLNI